MWRLPKEGYYFLQSQWTEKLMAHIAGHWSPPLLGDRRTVRVYSNADTVELLVNGRSLGVREPATADRVWRDFHAYIDQFRSPDEFGETMLSGARLRHGPFIWDDVAYEPGTLVAVARKGGAVVRDQQRTPGKAVRVALRSELSEVVRTGVDVSFIEADLVDAAGTVVPDARPWIHFNVEGPGRILGGTADIDAISGVAAINVQSSGKSGMISITATSPGFEAGSVRIRGRAHAE